MIEKGKPGDAAAGVWASMGPTGRDTCSMRYFNPAAGFCCGAAAKPL
jgi:hypothetical protein